MLCTVLERFKASEIINKTVIYYIMVGYEHLLDTQVTIGKYIVLSCVLY